MAAVFETGARDDRQGDLAPPPMERAAGLGGESVGRAIAARPAYPVDLIPEVVADADVRSAADLRSAGATEGRSHDESVGEPGLELFCDDLAIEEIGEPLKNDGVGPAIQMRHGRLGGPGRQGQQGKYSEPFHRRDPAETAPRLLVLSPHHLR